LPLRSKEVLSRGEDIRGEKKEEGRGDWRGERKGGERGQERGEEVWCADLARLEQAGEHQDFDVTSGARGVLYFAAVPKRF
jgi:hypothetical protein